MNDTDQMSFLPESSAEPPTPVDSVGAESEDEITSDLSGAHASISSTDWTVDTIIQNMRKGRIDLAPKFQRRAAWDELKKREFIESTMLRYPIPQLVLAEKRDNPGQFIVIDGKQRLLTLRQFYAGFGDKQDAGFEPLSLGKLKILKDVTGDIRTVSEDSSVLFDSFETHTIRTVVIRDWQVEDFLRTLFLRLNTGSLQLSPQELRQALTPGHFVDFVDEESGASLGLRALLGNDAPDRRMVDAELFVRFTGFQLGRFTYKSNLKSFLDDVCVSLNAEWSSSETAVRDLLENMERGIELAFETFEDHACHKWSGKWERSFNRAVFDVQIGAFSKINDPALVSANSEAIVEKFKELCDNDVDFTNALSTTTKSLGATRTRFKKWYEALNEILGTSLEIPSSIGE